MLITCENCHAVYSISNAIIGENGRKVKCAKCSHIWEVSSSKQNLKEENLTNKITIPTKKIVVYKNSNFLSLFLLFITISLSLIAYENVLIQNSWFKNIYSLFGVYDNNGLQITNVTYQIKNNELIINARLENKSGIAKKIPDIRYILLDDNRKKIFNSISKSSGKMIYPEESLALSTKILNLSYHAAYLQIDTFNVIEVALHKN